MGLGCCFQGPRLSAPKEAPFPLLHGVHVDLLQGATLCGPAAFSEVAPGQPRTTQFISAGVSDREVWQNSLIPHPPFLRTPGHEGLSLCVPYSAALLGPAHRWLPGGDPYPSKHPCSLSGGTSSSAPLAPLSSGHLAGTRLPGKYLLAHKSGNIIVLKNVNCGEGKIEVHIDSTAC